MASSSSPGSFLQRLNSGRHRGAIFTTDSEAGDTSTDSATASTTASSRGSDNGWSSVTNSRITTLDSVITENPSPEEHARARADRTEEYATARAERKEAQARKLHTLSTDALPTIASANYRVEADGRVLQLIGKERPSFAGRRARAAWHLGETEQLIKARDSAIDFLAKRGQMPLLKPILPKPAQNLKLVL